MWRVFDFCKEDNRKQEILIDYEWDEGAEWHVWEGKNFVSENSLIICDC